MQTSSFVGLSEEVEGVGVKSFEHFKLVHAAETVIQQIVNCERFRIAGFLVIFIQLLRLRQVIVRSVNIS